MAKEGGQKKTTPEADKSKKSTPVKKPAPAKQTKPMKEKSTKHTPSKKASKGKEPVGGVDTREPTSGITRSLLVVEGKGKAIATDEQRRTLVIEEASNRPLAQPKDDTSANIVRDTPFPPDAETGAEAEMSDSEGDTEILNVGEEKGEDVSNTVVLEERTVKLDEGQAGSDPSNTLESRPLLDEDQAGSNHVPSHVALVEPNPESMHEDNQPSLFGTLSSIKNLDDAFTYGDQFLYDKPTEEEPDKANVETEVESMDDKPTKEEPGKANVETKVDSMVTVPIHQDSTTIPPLSTPVVNLIQPKQVSPPNQEPIFTATTTTTTKTLPPPPPPLQQQSTTDPALAARYINENIKEAIQDALQAPVLECFKEFKKKRHNSDASASQQPQAQTSLAWKSSGTRETPSSSSQHKIDPQSEQPIDDIPIPDDVHILDSEDASTAQLPNIKTRPVEAYLEEKKLLWKTRDMGSFIKWYCRQIRKSKLSKADLEGPALKVVRPFHENSISFQFQMEECHLLLTDQIDLVNTEGNRVVPDVSKPLPLGGPPGNKERRNALSISKLKADFYQDFGLKELVPSLWIESEREYDISAAYGKINHLSGSDKAHLFNAVNLWIRNIVIRKHVEDLQLRIESYQTKLNLTEPSWDATNFLFKEDYTIVSKPRIMVKDFMLFEFNRGMEHRICSKDDKRRSKELIEVIERRLKIRRIFKSLKSFVSGRLRDVDYKLI
ncbi:hypothetical protein Tco_1545832 [Tanacetum coccineum]